MLKGKHIVVGVTGSIAAYKTASLVRLLVKEAAEVKVVMTPPKGLVLERGTFQNNLDKLPFHKAQMREYHHIL